MSIRDFIRKQKEKEFDRYMFDSVTQEDLNAWIEEKERRKVFGDLCQAGG